ncbi:MAG: lysoplasmalogenase family protein [Candidatus Thorarchaeota archaeon]
MKTLNPSSEFLIPVLLGSMGFLTILFSELIVLVQGSKIVQVTWLASTLIMISTFVIRFYSIDLDQFDQIIQNTHPIRGINLPSSRFLNWIVIAMVVGLIATITIAFDFIIGVVVYLLMQICLIISFTGIFSINPSILFPDPNLRRSFIFSLIFWLIVIPAIYFTLIYNGLESLIVIPYVIAIGIMALISWFGLGYNQRSPVFRWMIVIASLLFVFSDTLIGNARYGSIHLGLNQLIDVTYVLNILLVSHAILFLKDGSGRTPIK